MLNGVPVQDLGVVIQPNHLLIETATIMGDLFKCQKVHKYPFRKRKGLLLPGCESFK